MSCNNNHAEAYNNLGVLELRRGDMDRAQAFFATATSLFGNLYEAQYNQAAISNAQVKMQTQAIYFIIYLCIAFITHSFTLFPP